MKPPAARVAKPEWLKKRLPPGGKLARTERLLEAYDLNTVCREARCPNRNECYHQGTATFLILGGRCTRSCRFCSVAKEPPHAPDGDEPRRIADAVEEMGLSYVVITSVTRDDLEDGGASHFAAIIRALEERVPGIRVEVLVPDFQGRREALAAVMEAGPVVLNHNVETVPSLYPEVRPGADYERSIELLRLAARHPEIPAKSGLMVGLGERKEEVEAVLRDLRSAGVEIVTIGQYLQPAAGCLDVKEYVPPERFLYYARLANRMGFAGVASGPFVRSSHKAAELFREYLRKGNSI